jgi:PAS domain S-box-containing protein/putative nucleotidyltransferase with HDIG domain
VNNPYESQKTQGLSNEDRIKHLNLVLRAIRNVNQLIVKEKDRNTLIQRACELLAETRGYHSAWIALTDRQGKYLTSSQIGMANGFVTMREKMEGGQWPSCVRKALEKRSTIITEDPQAECSDCPISVRYPDRGAYTKCLEYDNRLYGVISISTPKSLCQDIEEQSLFEEVTDDLSFALHTLEIDYQHQQAQQQIQLMKEELELIFDSSPIMIYYKDKSGRNVMANKALANALGKRRDEIEGRLTSQLFPAQMAKQMDADDQEVIKSGKAKTGIEELYRAGNSLRWAKTSKVPLRNAQGEIIGIAGFTEDITERKKAEKELVESQERLLLAMDAGEHGFWDWDLETDEVYFSPRYYTMLGYEPGELPMHKDTWAGLMHPEDRKSIVPRVEEYVKNGEPYEVEFRLKCKDGSWKWISGRGKSYSRTEAGKPYRAVGVHVDITEHKRSEKDLQESEEKFRMLFEEAPDAYYLNDLKGRFTDGNRAAEELIGCTKEELIGKNILNFNVVPGKELKKTAQILARNALGKSSGPDELTIIRKDGTPAAVEIFTRVVRISGQKRVLGIARDISKRKAAQQQIEESEKKYRELFNTALVGITVHNAEGLIVAANQKAQEYFGLSEKQLTEKNSELWIGKLIKPDKTPMEESEFPWTFSVKADGPAENRIVGLSMEEDKSVRWFLYSARPILNEHNKPDAVITSFVDITERKQSEQNVKRLLSQQVAINQLALALGEFRDLEKVYHTVYEHCRQLMDVSAFIISDYDDETELISAAYFISDRTAGDATSLPPIPLEAMGRGTQSEVIRTGKPLNITDLNKAAESYRTDYTIMNDSSVASEEQPLEDEDISRSALLVPMKVEGKTVGVMQVQSSTLNGYSQEDMDLLSGMANVAAVAIDNAGLHQQMTKTLEETIRMAGLTLSMRDPYTARHQERVTELACAIAEYMGLQEDTIEGLRAAALLHDIGKIAIPADILSKPTQLTDNEFELIKVHPETAYEILKDVEFPWPVADIVLQHHERLDGSGYPNGISGDEIMLEARILAVADAVEAMISHRPYRPGFGVETALTEIENDKHSKYDPAAVDACVSLFREKGFEFTVKER